MGMTTSRWVALTLAACVALSGCNKSAPAKPGDPEVYKRIAATKDCAELQREFDTASANHDRAATGVQRETATAYMTAADERMREVGCYR